jgi:predicted enzyme related to lactoylglutathione lyase
MNKVVHFEITTDDKERAKKFYSDIFDWQIRDDKMPGDMTYTSAITAPIHEETYAPKEPGAINGALIERDSSLKSPVITIEVDDIEEYLEKIEAAGGTAVGEKGEVPGMGFYAYFKDTEGNILGLWQNAA